MGKKGDTPVSISPNPYTYFRILRQQKAEENERKRQNALANMAFADINQTGTLLRREDAPFFLNFSGEVKGQFSHVLKVTGERAYPSYFPMIFPEALSREAIKSLEQKTVHIKADLGSFPSGSKFDMMENNTYLSPTYISAALPKYKHNTDVSISGKIAVKPKIITDARGETAHFNVRVDSGAERVFLSCFATGDRARRLVKMGKGDRIQLDGNLFSEIGFTEAAESNRTIHRQKVTTNKILVKEF